MEQQKNPGLLAAFVLVNFRDNVGVLGLFDSSRVNNCMLIVTSHENNCTQEIFFPEFQVNGKLHMLLYYFIETTHFLIYIRKKDHSILVRKHFQAFHNSY